MAAARAVHAIITAFSGSSHDPGVNTTAVPTSRAAVSNAVIQLVRRSVCTATV